MTNSDLIIMHNYKTQLIVSEVKPLPSEGRNQHDTKLKDLYLRLIGNNLI